MILWIGAQLSPSLAPWIAERFGIERYSVKRLGYRDASNIGIFHAARRAGAVVDWQYLDARMREVLERVLPQVCACCKQESHS